MAFVTAARRYSYTDPDCLILAASLLPASGDTSPQLMFVCRCSVTYSCPTLCDPCTAAYQVSLSFTISWSLIKLMSVESVMPPNHLVLCCRQTSSARGRANGRGRTSVWRRKWQPTPVFLPGESQGRGSLVGCRLWGRTELDKTEAT